MYTIAGYGEMIADRGRMEPHVQALRQVVQPGSVVLDLGSGLGLFALLACKFGAVRVYAIEPASINQLAQDIAAQTPYRDRIHFIQQPSESVTLPEPVDVIIADLRGVVPLFQKNLLTLADARQRFLKPGGVLIPQCDRLWASIVETQDLYNQLMQPWEGSPYGFDLAVARQLVANRYVKATILPENLLAVPQTWATIDYTQQSSTSSEASRSADLTFTINRAGTGHGLAVWFETTLVETPQGHIGFSNAPDCPRLLYGQAFFPWAEKIALQRGDQVQVKLQARFINHDYVWRWQTQMSCPSDPLATLITLDQSTFWGTALGRSPNIHAEFVPKLTHQVEVDHLILSQIDGTQDVATIAHRLREKFPHQFSSWQETLTSVSTLCQRYFPSL